MAIPAGAAAYAAEQAHLQRQLKARFFKLWTGDKEVLRLLCDDAPEAEKANVAPVTVPYIYVQEDLENDCGGPGAEDDSDEE